MPPCIKLEVKLQTATHKKKHSQKQDWTQESAYLLTNLTKTLNFAQIFTYKLQLVIDIAYCQQTLLADKNGSKFFLYLANKEVDLD